MLDVNIDEVDVDAEAKWEFGKVKMHIHMYRLPLFRLESRIRALEA